jgi:uncharacterized protein YpbB
MPVFMANEVWQEVKRYIQQQDRADAADALVSVLIDNDVSPEEIKDTFKGDSEVKRALQSYIDDHQDDEEDDDYDDDYDDEDDDY